MSRKAYKTIHIWRGSLNVLVEAFDVEDDSTIVKPRDKPKKKDEIRLCGHLYATKCSCLPAKCAARLRTTICTSI